MQSLGESEEARHYFRTVEEHFGRLRGRPLLLAPRDVGLVKDWYSRGIPIAVVLRALDRYFRRQAHRERPRRQPTSLAFLVEDVVVLWDEWRNTHRGESEGDAPGDGRDSAEDITREHLEGLVGRLEAAVDRVRSEGRPGLARSLRAVVRETQTLIEKAATTPLEEIEERLAKAEKRVVKRATAELGDERVAALAAVVRSDLDKLQGDIDDKSFQALLKRGQARAILADLDLPRIALFRF